MKFENQMESSVYSIFSKSVIDGVEKFLIDIDQKDTVIPDDMVVCFRNMSRTLQRILSRCDKGKSQSKGQNDKNSSNQLESLEPRPMVKSLFDESFLYTGQKQSSMNSNSSDENHDTPTKNNKVTSMGKTESSVDVEKIRKKLKKAIESDDEEISDNNILEDSILNPPKIPDTELETTAFYKCDICDITIPKNNTESHIRGKSHRNKARSRSRDSKSPVKEDYDIEHTLEGVLPLLTKNKAGQLYIVQRAPLRQFYYCNICKVEIAGVSTNVLQHVLGSQHKRLCEASI